MGVYNDLFGISASTTARGAVALEVVQDDGDVGSSNGYVLFCPLTLVQIVISKNLFNQGYVILSKLSPTL